MDASRHLIDPINLLKKDKASLYILCLFVVFRMMWAAFVPLGADEAYYFDWSKDIHLSYYDHPPGVSWLAWTGQQIFGVNWFGARVGSIFAHFLSTLLLIRAYTLLYKDISKSGLRAIVCMSSFFPILSVGGFFIMPDLGLMLFISMMMVHCTQLATKKRLRAFDGISLGILFGLSFCFKYHGLAIGGGLCLGLLIIRRRELLKELNFWILLTLTPFLAAFPVFYWNAQNEWISFVYQSGHGFANPSFDYKLGLRTLLAQFVLLTPVGMVLFLKTIIRPIRGNPLEAILYWGAAPLAILLTGLSFFKEVLPHWAVPTVWVCLPLIARIVVQEKPRFLKTNMVFGAFLTLTIPSLLSLDSGRSFILKSVLKERPGALAELTLWDFLLSDDNVQTSLRTANTGNCQVSFASSRWFSTSQIAARQDEIKVYNLNTRKPSYYSFRDDLPPAPGCPVIYLSQSKYFDKKSLETYIDIQETTKFYPRLHKDQEIIMAKGVWKTLTKKKSL